MPDRKPRCYFIGNTHIDHTWLWNWTEGFDEVHASFRAALDRMNEFPEFVFTCSVALHYRWVEANDPAMFKEIQQRVKEGRWQIAGGWVVQSDNNIPCGEAFVRQGLYGQKYFESRFGRKAFVGYCVDSFGHHAQLPQILKLQGMQGWLHFRPDGNELKLPPSPYRWQAIDGSEVIAYRPPGWYCTPNETFYERTSAALGERLHAYPETLFFYGVGDHGGGPTIRDLQSIRSLREQHPEIDSVYGGLDEFYQKAVVHADELPIVGGELQHCFRGCYTTNGRLKSLNRRAEGRLLMAEHAAALASMITGADYPDDEINRAWDLLLTNHFHDVICGTCTSDAMEESIFRCGGILESADRIRHLAIKRVTGLFDRRPPGTYKESLAFCLSNSLSWDRSEPVEMYPHMPGRSITAPAIVDARGRKVEFQMVEPTFGTPSQPKGILFAPKIPAGGIALFHVVHDPKRKPLRSDLKCTKSLLENRSWSLRLDPQTGAIRSLVDKRGGVELVLRASRLADLLVMKDLGDTWGTGRARFGDQIGRFERATIRLLETGPLRARIEVRSEYRKSTSRQLISIYRDFDWIDFDLEVMWQEKLKTVKIAFPLAIENARALYEIPYGTLERPCNGEEQPMQKWIEVKGDIRKRNAGNIPYAFGIAADSIGGADVLATSKKGTEIRLTLLRSPYHGYLTYADAVESVDRAISDQGLRQIRYRLVGGGGKADLGLPEHGERISQHLQITFEGSQAGPQIDPVSHVRCDPVTVHVASMKKAENGNGVIVRVVETRGRPTNAVVTGPEPYPPIKTALRPFEIQTWCWSLDRPPGLCNLLEENA